MSAAAAAAIVVAGLLYWMLAGPVHAVDHPPSSISALKAEAAPKNVPVVAFTDAKGQRHTLAEFKGRYVLLNLWATWCAPCVRELPALAQLQAAIPKDKFTIVAVDVGRNTPADAAAFLKSHHAAVLDVYQDSDIALIRVFGAFGLPMSVLIDPQGREVARAMGPGEWDAPDAVAYFRAVANNSHS
ncbi:MAG TPA: TlpA disulfide reductase family protein [Rhizomicrobium sp.]|nr:TlpA disulfide reductase family protein [Rhizomicrobium sp.]